MNRLAFAMLIAGALLAVVVVRVLACGGTECQPYGGLTHPDLERIIMGEAPPAPPAPPAVGGPTQPEEDAPPTTTTTPTPVPTAVLVPPWVSTPTPVPALPRWELPKALPKAGS